MVTLLCHYYNGLLWQLNVFWPREIKLFYYALEYQKSNKRILYNLSWSEIPVQGLILRRRQLPRCLWIWRDWDPRPEIICGNILRLWLWCGYCALCPVSDPGSVAISVGCCQHPPTHLSHNHGSKQGGDTIITIILGWKRENHLIEDRSLQMFDSGLVVVVSIILSMIFCVFLVLTYVQYEWCNVLFKNFTVSKNYINIQ